MDIVNAFIGDGTPNIWGLKAAQTAVVLLAAVILSKFSGSVIRRAVHSKDVSNRAETLIRVFSKILSAVIWLFAAMQLCRIIFGVQPASLIAATGVLSVALGFGAQSLVKDTISGFFILFENQFAVGELVTIEGFNGTVKELTLRTTIIQNISGDMFIVPNGSITNVINHSRCERGVIVAVNISYEEDIDNALEIMRDTARKASAEIDSINGVPEVLGVSELGSSGIELKMLAKCVAGEQFAVERELLRRIKYAFDGKNVNIPYNHIVIVNKEGNMPKN